MRPVRVLLVLAALTGRRLRRKRGVVRDHLLPGGSRKLIRPTPGTKAVIRASRQVDGGCPAPRRQDGGSRSRLSHSSRRWAGQTGWDDDIAPAVTASG